MSEQQFDVVVIGGGPGGYVCAIRCAQLGMKVACVEKRQYLGGTCLNVGCIPSKAMLESSHHYSHALHDADDHGIELSGVSLNLAKLLARKDKVVSTTTSGVDFLFKKNKITRVFGHGRLLGSGQVAVEGDGESSTLQAKHIVVATGSTPIELPSATFDHKQIIDSTDALSLPNVPKHLIVIGGGVIGLELGSVWSRLGAEVSVVEAGPKILGVTDKAVSTATQKVLEGQGLKIMLSTMLERVETNPDGMARVFCKKGDEDVTLEGDVVLVAVGRKPYTDNLGLDVAGVALDDRGRISVDGRFQSSAAGVFAIGDVIAGPMLAHKAEEEGVALAEMLAGLPGHVNYEAIPSVVYTWPEVATVGRSEEQCKDEQLAYKVGKYAFKPNGRAKAMGCGDGFVKVIADATTDRLLGVHILGPNASELIAEIAIAFEFGASAEDIGRSVHAHPTLAEVIKEAALDVDKRAIHG